MENNARLDEKFGNRILTILEGLDNGLYERTNIVNLAFLSAIAGESIFMLGPPGVAKSLIARRLKFAFKDAISFEYLMHRFSTPDEVFGPISISKLKNEDKLERTVENYLPGANIAFLDEIWKAGPSIQNTLLTIINEKIFRNGGQELPVELFGLIAASNELPEEGQGLDALWDRFLIRTLVTNIEDRKSFEEMITSTSDLYADNLSEKIKITKDEYYQWQELRDQILIPLEILDLTYHIRVKIEDYNQNQLEKEDAEREKLFYISDRRWKKIIKILKTSAFLNGRKFVDLMDCFLIPYMLWDEPDQIQIVHTIVKESIRHKGYTLLLDLDSIHKEIERLSEEIKTETTFVKIKKFKKPSAPGPPPGPPTHPPLPKQEVLTKKPHNLLIKNWDKQIENLKEIIRNNLEKISQYKDIDLKFLKENIFVDAKKSDVIFQRIEELETQIHQFDLKCNEQYDRYHSIKEDEKVVVQSKSKTRRSKRG